jgi:hypothetical protein
MSSLRKMDGASEIIMGPFLTRLLAVVLAPSSATRRQRQTLGTIVLVVVVLMVVLGSLFLKGEISPGTSLLFWGCCFVLMLWAVFLAHLDVKSIKREFRARKKELFVSIFSKGRVETGPCPEGKERPFPGESGGDSESHDSD